MEKWPKGFNLAGVSRDAKCLLLRVLIWVFPSHTRSSFQHLISQEKKNRKDANRHNSFRTNGRNLILFLIISKPSCSITYQFHKCWMQMYCLFQHAGIKLFFFFYSRLGFDTFHFDSVWPSGYSWNYFANDISVSSHSDALSNFPSMVLINIFELFFLYFKLSLIHAFITIFLNILA